MHWGTLACTLLRESPSWFLPYAGPQSSNTSRPPMECSQIAGRVGWCKGAKNVEVRVCFVLRDNCNGVKETKATLVTSLFVNEILHENYSCRGLLMCDIR